MSIDENSKERISIGDENFADMMASDAFYVDKSFFIYDLFTKAGRVAAFTRPRRFGKTVNLKMLQCFGEMNYEAPADKSFHEQTIKELVIFKKHDFGTEHMGCYPVIFFSMKDLVGLTFQSVLETIRQ